MPVPALATSKMTCERQQGPLLLNRVVALDSIRCRAYRLTTTSLLDMMLFTYDASACNTFVH
eukprot:247657-Amphidinium_carterae.2